MAASDYTPATFNYRLHLAGCPQMAIDLAKRSFQVCATDPGGACGSWHGVDAETMDRLERNPLRLHRIGRSRPLV